MSESHTQQYGHSYHGRIDHYQNANSLKAWMPNTEVQTCT